MQFLQRAFVGRSLSKRAVPHTSNFMQHSMMFGRSLCSMSSPGTDDPSTKDDKHESDSSSSAATAKNRELKYTLSTKRAEMKYSKRISRQEMKQLSPEEKHKLAALRVKERFALRKQRRQEKLEQCSQEELEAYHNARYESTTASNARLEAAKAGGMKVCLDFTLDTLYHTKHDRSSLLTQLLCGYTFMKKSPTPFHLHLTSVNTPAVQEAVTKRGFHNWHVTVTEEAPWALFRGPVGGGEGPTASDVVVLSPDSTNVLQSFDPEKVLYVSCHQCSEVVLPVISL